MGYPGDLTYPYKHIGSNTKVIKEIVSNSHQISEKIKKSKKPIFILGESALRGKAGEYVFEATKDFLFKNNFIRKDWNALNILSQQASRVGSLDLNCLSIKKRDNFVFAKLKTNRFFVGKRENINKITS